VTISSKIGTLGLVGNKNRMDTMKKFRILFWAIYVFGVVGSIQTYQATYGGSVFSFAGIIDNFLVPLIAAAVIVGLVSLVHRTYLKIKNRSLGK